MSQSFLTFTAQSGKKLFLWFERKNSLLFITVRVSLTCSGKICTPPSCIKFNERVKILHHILFTLKHTFASTMSYQQYTNFDNARMNTGTYLLMWGLLNFARQSCWWTTLLCSECRSPIRISTCLVEFIFFD